MARYLIFNFVKFILFLNYWDSMDNLEEGQEIIQQKVAKVNGEHSYLKYKKGKLLGKGGFAKCYEGLNLENKKMCAIKVIEKSTLQKSRAKQKLLSQIKIHKALQHKHIVKFDSVFEDQKNVYIILQLCVNKTLSEMVKTRKKLTTKQIKYFMLQIISALQYMHSNRVIHRDLKMGNIFIDENMDLKIGDFGLATKLQFFDEKKRTMCGTPNYIAPQIVQGAIGHSYEVDIWSTGVICYALMFGKPPFQTNEVKMTYKKIKSCDYTFPTINVPEQGKDFIRKLLVLDPKQRLTIKQMLNHQFMQNQQIPKYIPQQALTTIPNFRNGLQSKDSLLGRVKSSERMRQKSKGYEIKLNQNKNGLQGMTSPRNAFNNQENQLYNQIDRRNKQEQHKLHTLVFVDYSKKYGLGYLINNKHYGVYFNDETLISTNHEKSIIYFIENPAAKKEKLQVYTPENMPKERDFQKKYLLLEKFIVHLNDEVLKLSKDKVVYHQDDKFVYMKQWLKTRHAIMFGLSNKVFQVNFFDNSRILLNTDKKTVLFTSKKNQVSYETLSNALQASDTEMTRRIKYTKQILNSIKNKKEENKVSLQGK